MKTQLTVHLGMTGHCKLPEAHRQAIAASLATILTRVKQHVEALRKQYHDFLESVGMADAPVYRLISSIAKGADTLAAQEALAQGYRLQVSLPFCRETYAEDFAEGEERDTYAQLLSKAESVFEIALGKKGEHSAPAYADASSVMLCHSDLLIAVWDGQRAEHQAGTYATIREAKKSRIPVIIIPTDKPEAMRFELAGTKTTDWEEGLRQHLRTILLPASKDDDIKAKSERCEFIRYAKKAYDYTIGLIRKDTPAALTPHEALLFPIPGINPRQKPKTACEKLLDFFPSLLRESTFRGFCLRLKPVKDAKENPAEAADKQAQTITPVLPCEAAWTERKKDLSKAGNYYGENFRNHLYQQYFLPVLCLIPVIIALNFNNFGLGNAIKYLSEGHIEAGKDLILSCILLVVFLISLVTPIKLYTRDNTQAELSRHITYRLLSERCRLAIYVSASGFCRIFSPMTEWGDRHWADWYFRLLARTDGMPNQQGDKAVTHDYLCNWLHRLSQGFLSSQERYHTQRWKENSNINDLLHCLALLFFKLSLYTSLSRIALSLAYSHMILPERFFIIIPILGCLMLILPCLGMFFAAYANYANYPTQITVSTAMEQTCKTLKEEAAELQCSPDLRFRDVLELCNDLEDRCAGEVSDWESAHNHDKSWERSKSWERTK